VIASVSREFQTDAALHGVDGGTVVIRNPWGGDDGTPKGTIKISLKQFLNDFSTPVVENK